MTKYFLYKKTHNKTGLNYLGYTTKNPHEYSGSGKYWKRHIQLHGNDVKTEVLVESDDKNEVVEKGQYYSDLWNITSSEEWANLKPETGQGGTFVHRQDSIERIREYQQNKKVWTELALENRLKNMLGAAADRKGKKNPQHSEFMSSMIRTEESNKKRSITLSGRKTSKGRTGHVYPDEKKITCEYCHKRILPGYYHRYHGDKCKHKEIL